VTIRCTIAFLSSNGKGAYAAAAFGMRAFRCNRYNQLKERLPWNPEREIRSLAELPGLLEHDRIIHRHPRDGGGPGRATER